MWLLEAPFFCVVLGLRKLEYFIQEVNSWDAHANKEIMLVKQGLLQLFGKNKLTKQNKMLL